MALSRARPAELMRDALLERRATPKNGWSATLMDGNALLDGRHELGTASQGVRQLTVRKRHAMREEEDAAQKLGKGDRRLSLGEEPDRGGGVRRRCLPLPNAHPHRPRESRARDKGGTESSEAARTPEPTVSPAVDPHSHIPSESSPSISPRVLAASFLEFSLFRGDPRFCDVGENTIDRLREYQARVIPHLGLMDLSENMSKSFIKADIELKAMHQYIVHLEKRQCRMASCIAKLQAQRDQAAPSDGDPSVASQAVDKARANLALAEQAKASAEAEAEQWR
ncbi:uncharacterized protein LOC141823866 [Curcuma longa]|uniref:uncharacterized protein LOC141823866 n=1 Tax=Curcuma longa TaxID=136217 RepID=UPI003D9DC97D